MTLMSMKLPTLLSTLQFLMLEWKMKILRNPVQEAKSLRHLLTHKPANKYCDACNLGKMCGTKKICGSFGRSRQPTRWLELVTADHLVAQNGSMEGITGDCDAIIIKDLFSKVKALFPVFSKTGQEAENVLRRFFGDKRVETFYSDNAPELKLACKTWALFMSCLSLVSLRTTLWLKGPTSISSRVRVHVLFVLVSLSVSGLLQPRTFVGQYLVLWCRR